MRVGNGARPKLNPTTMRVLLVPAFLAIHQGDALVFRPVPSLSRVTTAAASARPRATTPVGILPSREDGDVDEGVEELMNSLKSSGLFGENGGGAAGPGGGGRKGLAAAARDAAADLEEPGKLVREAAKPFREEMDRIEADFQRSISEKEEEMERKLEGLMKKIDDREK